MFCDEVLELIEPIAGGDETPDDRVAVHLASCRDCAAALGRARDVERLLQARTTPKPSHQFTSRIVGRIRRERWRREQFLDFSFNLVVGFVVLVVLSGFWVLLSGSGVTGIGRDALNLLNGTVGTVARRVAPSLPLYLGAVALVGTALGVWWWAEQKSEI
jgi:predicted anti-sigma-YlaC factor YlaD